MPGRIAGPLEGYKPHAGMHVDEKSDEAILPWKRPNKKKATSGGGRGGKGLTQGKQPADGRGSDTEPNCPVDPTGGCALDRGRVPTARFPAFGPRKEPGALAAPAGICAGGEERSSFLPRPSSVHPTPSALTTARVLI